MRRILILIMLAGTPAQAHDWYTGKQDPYTHSDCCDDKDCHAIEPAEVRQLANGDYLYVPYRWTIPRYRVLQSDDDRYHICVAVRRLDELKGRPEVWRNWRCFFVPRHTSQLSGNGLSAPGTARVQFGAVRQPS